MATRVSYVLEGAVATITMDDGKVNVLSIPMLVELNEALDRALTDRAVVVLSGREGVFSAGFDLAVLQSASADAPAMLQAGFVLAERLLSFPTPVVMACTGHTIAMGVFLLLSGDYRIGVDGPFKITANEVAIGLTMPRAAVEICRQRLSPAAFGRAVGLAEVFSPDNAVAAGFLDRVVPPTDLEHVAAEVAADLAKLNMNAHGASKLRVRGHALTAIRAAIEADDADVRALA
jgi:enoyl-CoA hydratase